MKESKDTANYRAYPNRDERCVRCTMFIPPDGCTAVRGEIVPQGWCDYFARKLRKRAESPFAKGE